MLESLQREGFQPFFACQTRVRDPGRRGYTKHMLRLRRDGEINGQHVPEIILLNSHDGTSSYQMLPGYFRFVCQNGCVCGESLGEVRVPHRGIVVDRVIEGDYEVVGVFDRIEEMRDAMQSLILPPPPGYFRFVCQNGCVCGESLGEVRVPHRGIVVDRVIEGDYEVVGVFDRIEEMRDAMQSLILPPPSRQALAQAALTYRYGDEHRPVLQVRLPERMRLWSVSGGSACSAPGKCGGQSH